MLLPPINIARPWRSALLLGFVLVPILLSAGERTLQPAPSPLAFFSNRDGDTEIYLMAADGTGVRQLTHNTVEDRDPAWAPGGARLTFVSRRDGNSNIYLINADGTGLRQLTTSPKTDHSASWSPDGRRIVYVSDDTGNQELYVLAVDGKAAPIRLTDHPHQDFSPVWAPGGDEVIFNSTRDFPESQDDAGDLFVVNVKTRATRRLVTDVRRTVSASWSSRNRIAFFAVPNRERHVYVVAPDGSGLTNLSAAAKANADISPSWSPDGSQIAFQGARGSTGQLEVYVMQADGAAARRVSPPGRPTLGPVTWSPDGTRVAYSAFEGGNWEVHVSAADGSASRRLTSNTAMDLGVVWAPAAAGGK